MTRVPGTCRVLLLVFVAGAALTAAQATNPDGSLRPAGPVTRLFTQDAAVYSLALGLVPLLVAFSLVSNCAIVTAYGLVGLKRSAWQLAAVGTGYGLLALAMVPAATAWGLAGVWGAMIATAALIWALQITGFVRHSAALEPAAA